MSEIISYVDPTILKVHPRNTEFFDDIDGADFDRLVESIKDHGVLTPLRVTKDMTIISGHQRTRAAIEAGCGSIPVIIDDSDDDNDVLMKLIETNFGRMKNDPIKQAKWIKEYEELKGVRQGSARQKVEPQFAAQVTQDEIAKELGVSRDTLQRLKSLLTLDPVLQAYISEGKIRASTGYNILVKLSPEEQKKLIDRLPDDVKLSAPTIEAHIEAMREELVGNTDKAMQEVDKLTGANERLRKENNELRAGALPISEETQNKINQLEEDKRKYYEESQRHKKENERLRGEMDKALKAKALAEVKANGGDDAVVALQNEIDQLTSQLEAAERKSNDLEYQLEVKEDEIKDLKSEQKEGYERRALRLNETPEEFTQRERDALVSNIQMAVGQFQSHMEGLLTQSEDFYQIDKSILKVLVETTSQAINAGNRIKTMLLAASGVDVGDEMEDNADKKPYDPRDTDYVFDDDEIGLEFNLGA